jgi:hypothetical protein
MPLRRIRVTVGTHVAVFELDTHERLRHRINAKDLMQKLKPFADEMISKQARTISRADAVPALFPSPAGVRRILSIDHIPIFAVRETAPQTEPEIFSSCVSFIQGTFAEDLTASPARSI